MSKFDEVIPRHGTACLKYDFAKARGMPKDALPFWVADMDFKTPSAVIDELIKRSRHGIFGYTDVTDDYLNVVANWFKKRHNWEPNTKNLVVTPGVVYALSTAIRAYTKEGNAVLISPPVYYPFAGSVRSNKRKLVESPLVLRNGRYEMDFNDFEQKIKGENVKLFILCSPHNPVGRVWTREELSRIADICLKYGVIVIADEIHHDIVRPDVNHTVFASLSPEIEQITVACTSVSKTFNLAGLQLANIFIENNDLRQRFKDELWAAGYSQPNALGLFAAKAAYESGEAWLEELLLYLEGNIEFTKDFLKQNFPKVDMIEPEGTYLLWLDFRKYGLTDKDLDDIIIHKCKLWLDSGHIFGAGGSGFQRINVACPKSVLKEGLERLKKCFSR